MGSGKTHTITHLSNEKLFPLSFYLKISPDRIRKFLPEYSHLLSQNTENVGRLMREEVGYLCEIIVWQILQLQVCIWFDSSLMHQSFFEGMFSRIHLEYPDIYRIALFHIHAYSNSKIIFERAAKRSLVTNRIVPQSDIQRSIEQVPISVNNLRSFVDCIIDIDNESNEVNAKLMKIQMNNFDFSGEMDGLNGALLECCKSTFIEHPTWKQFSDIFYSSNGDSNDSRKSKL